MGGWLGIIKLMVKFFRAGKRRAGDNASQTGAQIVVSSGSKGHGLELSRGAKRGILVGTIVALVGVGGYYIISEKGLLSGSDRSKEIALREGQAVKGQVENLQPSDLNALADAKTDPGKDLDKSYAKAVALFQRGDSQASVKEYERITELPDDVPYYIRIDYAAALSRLGDFEGAIRQTEAAIRSVKANTSMDENTRAAVMDRLESNLSGYKDLAGTS